MIRQTNKRYLFVFIVCGLCVAAATWTVSEKFIGNGAAALAVNLALAALIAFLFERYLEAALNRSVDQVVAKINRVSQGDLTQRFKEDPDDALPYGLSYALGEMMQFLRSQVGEVWRASALLTRQLEQLGAFSNEALEKFHAETRNLASIAGSIEAIRSALGTMAGKLSNLRVSSAHDVAAMEKIDRVAHAALADVKTAAGALKAVHNDMRELLSLSAGLGAMTGDFLALTRHASAVAKDLTDLSTESNIVKLNASIDAAQNQPTEENYRQLESELRRLIERITAMVLSGGGSSAAAQSKIAELSKRIGGAQDELERGLRNAENAGTLMNAITANLVEATTLYRQVSGHIKNLDAMVTEADAATWEFTGIIKSSNEGFDKLKADTEITRLRFGELERKIAAIDENLKKLETFKELFKIG